MIIGAVIQARTGSKRLPSKVLLDINGEPMLTRVIQRVRHSRLINKIIVATTTDPQDDVIHQLAILNGVDVFRGDVQDVLRRYYGTAKKFGLDIIVRVTADCPLLDASLLDEVLSRFITTNCKIATNAGIDSRMRTYPRGLDVEVFSYEELKKANKESSELYQREHVTPYMYSNKDKIELIQDDVDNSVHRWTVDTVEDLDFIRKIFEGLSIEGEYISYIDVLKFLEDNPELMEINHKIVQKNYFEVDK
jgi:spore coat polysaccharide biosynthesis protein SpsF